MVVRQRVLGLMVMMRMVRRLVMKTAAAVTMMITMVMTEKEQVLLPVMKRTLIECDE